MLFLKCWDVAFLLWFPSAGLPVGKAFCSLSFSLSSLCPSLVWMYALFIEFSRRWFRRELLAMMVSVLEVLCYGLCVCFRVKNYVVLPQFPWSVFLRSCGLLTIACLYLGAGLAQGWDQEEALQQSHRGSSLASHAHIPVWLFSFFLSLACREC